MSASEPQFTRLTGTDLFWLDDSGKTIGFESSPGASIGDTPTLSQTWANAGGIYFFLGVAPADDDAFAAALLPYLTMQGWPHGPRYLWLQNPNDSSYAWVGQTLSLARSGSDWKVSRRADFRFDSYVLTIPSGGIVTLGTAAQNWGWAFASSGTLFAPGGTYSVNGDQILLPLADRPSGCWRFAIDLTHGADTDNDFKRLRVGLRYFYPDDPNPEAFNVFVRAIELNAIEQPTSGTMTLDVSLDVLHPLVPDRTHFSFFPAGVGTQPAMDSAFATARGYGVTLTPLAAAGTTPDARLVFNEQPLYTGKDGNVPKQLYLTLDGAYAIGWMTDLAVRDAAGHDIYRLLCGTSGLEYLGMPEAAPSQLLFVPGNPAYTNPLPSADPDVSPLKNTGTTSWVYASTEAATSIYYYAQPEGAPLYQAPPASAAPRGDEVGSVFLDFFEVPALALSSPDPTRAFPMAPYRDLAADSIEAARRVEATAIAPVRRKTILTGNADAWALPANALTHTAQIGVTPQGIAIGVASDGMQWTWVGIANDSDDAARPDLGFTKAGGKFRQALQTNRLFMVMANADEFMRNGGSIAYRLTAEGIAELRAAGIVPANVLDPVEVAFSGDGYPIYDTEDDFVAALLAATPDAEPYELDFERVSGLLVPVIDDWAFQMSPRNWDNPQPGERTSALVVWKFATGRSLEDLTRDVSTWTWPEVAAQPGGTISATQAQLLLIYRAAEESYESTGNGPQSPYANFMQILRDPYWSGIIAFSVDVPLNTLPQPLQALAAGIDRDRFYAHHVGFNVTPYGANPGSLVFRKTSMFGLIDYDDDVDQYFEENIDFAFKVLQLTVGFRNSVMTDFSSRVELLINRMLGATTHLYPTDHGNNVILNGVYQTQTDSNGVEQGTYVFSMVEQNTLALDDSALRKIALLSTQLVTTQPADARYPEKSVVALFQMGGDFYFYDDPRFDVLSFGLTIEEENEEGNADPDEQAPTPSDSALRFGNLAVKMEFTMADPTPSFSLVTETLSFDLANSKPRRKSLFAAFPLKLASFVATPDPLLTGGTAGTESVQKPESLGYVSVTAPLQQSLMIDPWYGIVYEIDLGTLGALAGSAGLTLRLLAGWSGGGSRDEPAVYLGVRLPGMKDAIGVELPLQGVIDLGFRTIDFVVNENVEADTREYLLRFRNFSLTFLGVTIPPGGKNDIILCGNPDQSSTTKLAWYAAYSAADDKKKQSAPTRTQRLVAARRLPPDALRRDR